jgi:polysaccharide deacetylase 2 family uncharacterized protein YibQ
MRKFYVFTVSGKSLFLFLFSFIAVISLFFCRSLFSPETGPAAAAAEAAVGSAEEDPPEEGGKLAIVIDDFGSGRDGVNEMMSIKEHLTFAVIPFCANTLEDAEIAHGNGYEVIVHLSMEPNYGSRSWLAPKSILAGMGAEEVRQIVRESFDSVPYAAGANIHMGSKASNDEEIMSAVLEVIGEKGLYFVDSRTASKPKAKQLSMKKGIVCYERDVFLDGQQPKSFIKGRLEKAAEMALKKGYAVAAGHVGQEGGKVTAEAIKEMLPEFKRRNIELVFVSELNEAVSIEE